MSNGGQFFALPAAKRYAFLVVCAVVVSQSVETQLPFTRSTSLNESAK